ncbi:MAG: hypothetical protein V7637_4957 [Mycobacteriales bacterium]
MSFYGDPDELDRLAGQITAAATHVRDQAGQARNKAGTTQWQSTAATAFRGQVDRDAAAVEKSAEALDQAAAALRAHAATVRARIAEIRAIEHAVTDWFVREGRALENAASAAWHAVTHPGETIRRLIPDPPWHSWPYTPQSLPAPGDKEWLEVGQFMRGQGVLR